jgi:hypothetical protein
MYTIGIRKIHSSCIPGIDFKTASHLAASSGYSAMNFNGTIYIETGHVWIETVFRIDDFCAI